MSSSRSCSEIVLHLLSSLTRKVALASLASTAHPVPALQGGRSQGGGCVLESHSCGGVVISFQVVASEEQQVIFGKLSQEGPATTAHS